MHRKKKKKTLSTIYMYNLQTGVSLEVGRYCLAASSCKFNQLASSSMRACAAIPRFYPRGLPFLFALASVDRECPRVSTRFCYHSRCDLFHSAHFSHFRWLLLLQRGTAVRCSCGRFLSCERETAPPTNLVPGRQIARRDGAASFCFAAKARANYTSPF